MGTTCTTKPKGMSMKDFFIDHGVLRWGDHLPNSYRVLETAYKMPVFYAAVETVNKETGERRVWAAVIKVHQTRGDYGFCYKDMDETMGPVYTDCPAKILDLLTPTDNEYANEWRARCRRNLEVAAERKNGIAPGVVLQYGDRRLTVMEKLPRGYLKVKDELGDIYRMKPGQVRNSQLVQVCSTEPDEERQAAVQQDMWGEAGSAAA